jgi:hypothetical protein
MRLDFKKSNYALKRELKNMQPYDIAEMFYDLVEDNGLFNYNPDALPYVFSGKPSSNTGLIIGLIAGGLVVAAGVVALVIVLKEKTSIDN